MRSVRFVSVFVLLALLLSAGSGAVMAQEPPPDLSDPEAVGALVEELGKAGDNADELWAELSPEAQAAVLEYTTVERFEPVVTTQVDRGGCKQVQVELKAYSWLGIHAYSYFQRIDFCYDGEWITSHSRNRWGEVYTPNWHFVDHVADSERGGIGSNLYESWTKGHFKLVVGGNPIDNDYPWIDMTVYGDGSWDHSSGGG